jgi:ATP-binding protein involved in chromosome partitioning
MTGIDDLRSALSRVKEPELGGDLVSLGMVKHLSLEGGRASATVELTTPACPLKEKIKKECEDALRSVPGVVSAEVALTHKILKPSMPGEGMPDLGNVIPVYATKGGVGKSTVAVNLAVSLALDGAKVGLFDADIHGPNVPLMMGTADRAAEVRDKKLLPVEAHGVKTMSWGYLAEEGKPRIWRGPLVNAALKQSLRDTLWGDLDYLVVDLPPGTGDASLTLIQNVPLAGVVFVTTPQKASLQDGAKGIEMFRKMNVPLLGMVENMAGMVCPHCGKETRLLPPDGPAAQAAAFKIPILASIPLDPDVAQAGESGVPVVAGKPGSPRAKALRWMAQVVAGRVSVMHMEALKAEGLPPAAEMR